MPVTMITTTASVDKHEENDSEEENMNYVDGKTQ